MCLAVPAIVIAHDASIDVAVVDLAGVRKEVSTVLVDDVKIGEYVLIHVGYALYKLSEKEACRTLAMFDDLGSMNATEDAT